jgi:hypothetical protein
MTTDLVSLRENVVSAARNCTDIARLQSALALLQPSTLAANTSNGGTPSSNTDAGGSMSREDFLKKLRGA